MAAQKPSSDTVCSIGFDVPYFCELLWPETDKAVEKLTRKDDS
jgi:hypothetical protein